jgi:5-formyltetrahydrofolate cyclo-ligase
MNSSARKKSATANTKARLRKELRQRRQSPTHPQQQSAARQLCSRFSRLSCFRRSQTIALYCANDGEIELQRLLDAAWRAGKETFLPTITGVGQMEFRRYRSGEPLKLNQYGIAEPHPGREVLAALELDLIIAPLVGFDRRGYRLGMGGGYYDRALKQRSERIGKPLLIGAAHSFQELEEVPAEAWDRRLQGVVTEQAYYRCQSR